jgi:hypothetical protein
VTELQKLIESSDRAALVDRVEEVVSAYLDQLDDPGEVDSGDLAENIVIQLEKP